MLCPLCAPSRRSTPSLAPSAVECALSAFAVCLFPVGAQHAVPAVAGCARSAPLSRRSTPSLAPCAVECELSAFAVCLFPVGAQHAVPALRLRFERSAGPSARAPSTSPVSLARRISFPYGFDCVARAPPPVGVALQRLSRWAPADCPIACLQIFRASALLLSRGFSRWQTLRKCIEIFLVM